MKAVEQVCAKRSLSNGGLEVGVASTKTYTASITALYLLACYLGQERGTIDREQMGGLLEPLAKLPNLTGEMMKREPEIGIRKEAAPDISGKAVSGCIPSSVTTIIVGA